MSRLIRTFTTFGNRSAATAIRRGVFRAVSSRAAATTIRRSYATPSLISTVPRAALPRYSVHNKAPIVAIAPSQQRYQPIMQRRYFADGSMPSVGDSITEVTLESWSKSVGDYVEEDEQVCSLETEKTNQDILAPTSGTISEVFAEEGANLEIGAQLFTVAPGGEKPKSKPKKEEPKAEASKSEAKAESKPEAPKKQETKPAAPAKGSSSAVVTESGLRQRRVPMSRMRKRIAERLKDSQNTAAMLTTFQEVDMFQLAALRGQYKEEFQKVHGVKLGFMSAFVRASTIALESVPVINAQIDGNDIVYNDDVDISVAVATPKGLVTPVLRDCGRMSFADIEKEIAHLGQKARNGQITLEDLAGGTFTISNGGVYGSMMGTPIINPPQSGILGMHGITKRAVVVNDKVEVRPVMYLALTYDHRLIDGREAVTFLKSIKSNIEDPSRMLLDL